MKVAVFDVCGTLYSSNTTFDFLDVYFKDNARYKLFRKISRSLIAKILNYPLYKFLNYDLIRIVAIGFLKGEEEKKVKVAARKFVDEFLVTYIKKDVEDLYYQYKSKGYQMILMSGSLDFIISHVASFFSADNFFATKLEVREGVFTGNVTSDQLFNKKEVLHGSYAVIDSLVVVSDNVTDFDLIKYAHEAYAICNKPKQKVFWLNKNLAHVEIID